MSPVKRNTVVLFVVLFLLAAFGWAGWANWESRRQAATRAAAMAAPADLVMPGSDADLPPTIAPMLDKPAPDFTLEDVRGKKVSLDAYKGKAVLINFWATWCGPCKIETPWLVDLRNQYAAKGFEILAVSEDDLDPGDKQKLKEETQQIASFAEQMHMDYPVLLCGDTVSKPYGGLDSLPTSFFVDRNGKVVAAQVGLTSKDEIEGNIRKALGGQS